MRRNLVLGSILIAGLAGAAAAAQTTGPHNPPLVIASVAGRDLYEFYCSSCHGRNGKGDGPVASALKTPPGDLTRLAARNGGLFPTARVTAYVMNDADIRMASHGSYEMPVWGPVFRALDNSDAMTRVRIANVVSYIESMQERTTH